MKRWLPHPGLSLLLAGLWCLLNASVHPAHLLLGMLFGWSIPLALAGSLPATAPMRRPGIALRLAGRFAWDVVLANLAVAALVLNPARQARSHALWMPLRLRDPRALALLSTLVTMTPGTLSARLSDDQQQLQLHLLDSDDPDGVLRAIREDYERPLLAIFGEETQ